MSSCWTFRLNRRKAFSRGSPSCNLTSANDDDTPKLTRLDRLEFCSVFCASQALSRKNQPKPHLPGACLNLRQCGLGTYSVARLSDSLSTSRRRLTFAVVFEPHRFK